jgi:hypothetical protein
VKRRLLRVWAKSTPLLADSVSVWSGVLRGRHLLLDGEGGAEAAAHLSKMHIKLAR